MELKKLWTAAPPPLCLLMSHFGGMREMVYVSWEPYQPARVASIRVRSHGVASSALSEEIRAACLAAVRASRCRRRPSHFRARAAAAAWVLVVSVVSVSVVSVVMVMVVVLLVLLAVWAAPPGPLATAATQQAAGEGASGSASGRGSFPLRAGVAVVRRPGRVGWWFPACLARRVATDSYGRRRFPMPS